MRTEDNAQYIKMTETPVSRLIISLGIPTLISMLITSLYNMADTIFVGTLGTSASGAIGVGSSVLGLDGKPSELDKKQACAAVGQH